MSFTVFFVAIERYSGLSSSPIIYRFPVLTLDYSENIALKPKFEVQAAHFSGRQHTLHCCVIESDGVNNYVRITTLMIPHMIIL